jgi:hypothetical protein
VQRDGRADQPSRTKGGIGASPATAWSATSTGVPSSTIRLNSPMNRPSRRLTMKEALSLTRMQVFFRPLPTAKAVASAGVVGLLAGDDLEQRHDRDRVEEVEARRPAPGAPGRLAISVIDRRGGVGREHAGGDDRLDLGEDLLLDAHLLEDGLDDEVGVGEAVLARRAGDQPLERLALSWRSAPWRARRARRGHNRRPCRPAPGRGRS